MEEITDKFETIWRKYPKKLGKKEAQRHFKASVKSCEDWFNIQRALENYRKYVRNVESRFIQHGKTWFRNWEDWIDFSEKEPMTGTPDKDCTRCWGSGEVYAPGSGKKFPCGCLK